MSLWTTLLEEWKLSSLKLDLKLLQAEFKPGDADRAAAWELYVEMLTRIVTQPLPDGVGDEKTALESVVSLFPTTREVLRRHGPGCVELSKLAIPMLNQMVRPFTAKWHGRSLDGAFQTPEGRAEFRAELRGLQAQLECYQRALADVAGVEDISALIG